MKAIISFGCVVLAAASMGASWSNVPVAQPVSSPNRGDDQPRRGLLSRESSVHAIVVAAFEEGGWPKEHALIHADNVMARYGVQGHELSEALPAPDAAQIAGKSLLSPLSNVHAIVMEAFRASGWSEADALAHTEYALVKAGYPAAAMESGCQVREIVIQHCVGQTTTYTRTYMHIQCYWQLFPDPLPEPCNFLQCQSPNVPWYTMHTKAGCSLGYEGCVRIWFRSVVTIKNCSEVLGCDCFEEESCEDITAVDCCPEYTLSGSGGCSNCPCPSPP